MRKYYILPRHLENLSKMLSTLQIIVHFLPKITIFYLLFTYFSGIPLNSIALLIAIALDIIDYIPIFP